MDKLRIDKLRLENYRCFDVIEVTFDRKLTVLVADNGAGKTSILDAIAVAFGPYIGAFDEATGAHFQPSDIRLERVRQTRSNEMEPAADGARLTATGKIPLGDLGVSGKPVVTSEWSRALANAVKGRTTIKDAKCLIDYGKRLQELVRRAGEPVLLPLLAYYGTGRLWQQKKLTSAKLPHTSRTVGYTDCLDPASSYKSLVAWFGYWTTNALKEQVAASKAGVPHVEGEFDEYIASVGGAVNTCLKSVGWKNISYSLAKEEMVIQRRDAGELAVDLLSDGVRNMIGMVADMAFRATKLNPQLGREAATKTPGIVLIDEVDMHLHPSWQQLVLPSLLEAFPSVQFIVTTHSPQVLSTVKREQIRVIGRDAEGRFVATMPLSASYGEPSGQVLHGVMAVDPQPPVPEKADLQKLTELVDQGEFDSREAVKIWEKLDKSLGKSHPQLQRLQRSVQRQTAW
jgi:predicted ATP-binding protein involved in virulence